VTTLLVSHASILSGLTPGSLYHYRVKSRDAAGNLATSADSTFTTLTSAPPPPTGPIGSWSFSEGSGTLAADSSGNGLDGTLVNGTAFVAGPAGQALSFDGVDDYADVSTAPPLDTFPSRSPPGSRPPTPACTGSSTSTSRAPSTATRSSPRRQPVRLVLPRRRRLRLGRHLLHTVNIRLQRRAVAPRRLRRGRLGRLALRGRRPEGGALLDRNRRPGHHDRKPHFRPLSRHRHTVLPRQPRRGPHLRPRPERCGGRRSRRHRHDAPAHLGHRGVRPHDHRCRHRLDNERAGRLAGEYGLTTAYGSSTTWTPSRAPPTRRRSEGLLRRPCITIA